METDLCIMYRIAPLGVVADEENWFEYPEDAEDKIDVLAPFVPEGVELSVIDEVF